MLTQTKLKDVLDYSPTTGMFTWKISKSGNSGAGSNAGHMGHHGYWMVTVEGRDYVRSRLAFLFMDGYFPENEADHINRDTRDDRWSNLRHVSHSCNMKNRGLMKDNKSGIPGVLLYKAGKSWQVTISSNKKRYFCGYFKAFKDAVMARWEAEKKHGFNTCYSKSLSYKYLSKNNLI
jgi:hypothetical protein